MREEENVSPNSAKINKARDNDWCICGCCKKEIREINCLCCQLFVAISEENFEGNQ